MSDYQETRYLRLYDALKNAKDFNKNLEHGSNIIWPDLDGNLMIGEAGYKTYMVEKRQMRIFKEENILTYSAKLYELLQRVKKSKGKVAIYSQYINNDGIALIEWLLRANGIRGYVSLTGNMSAQNRKNYIEQYNSPENDNGGIIKFLLFSNVLAEGITLKSVREIHIFEPGWNLSGLDQVTGRVFRNNSHSRLLPTERNVTVFRYCAIPKSNYKLSSDLSKYIKAGRKDFFIKKLERALIKASFLCEYTKKTNLAFTRDYRDGDRECEYESCNYSCDSQLDLGHPIDSSTYDTSVHNPELHKLIKNHVSTILVDRDYLTLPKLMDSLQLQKVEAVTSMRNIVAEDMGLIVKDNNYIKKSFTNQQTTPKAKQKIEQKLEKTTITMDEDGRLYIGGGKGKFCSSYSKDQIFGFFDNIGAPKPDKRLSKDLLCLKLGKILKLKK